MRTKSMNCLPANQQAKPGTSLGSRPRLQAEKLRVQAVSRSRTPSHVLKSRLRRVRAANPRARRSAEAKRVADGADAGAAVAAAESACRNRSLSGQPASLRGKRRANRNAARAPNAPSEPNARSE